MAFYYPTNDGSQENIAGSYQDVDEVSANDSDYVYFNKNATGNVYGARINLTGLTAGAWVEVKFRINSWTISNAQGAAAANSVELWIYNNKVPVGLLATLPTPGTWTTYAYVFQLTAGMLSDPTRFEPTVKMVNAGTTAAALSWCNLRDGIHSLSPKGLELVKPSGAITTTKIRPVSIVTTVGGWSSVNPSNINTVTPNDSTFTRGSNNTYAYAVWDCGTATGGNGNSTFKIRCSRMNSSSVLYTGGTPSDAQAAVYHKPAASYVSVPGTGLNVSSGDNLWRTSTITFPNYAVNWANPVHILHLQQAGGSTPGANLSVSWTEIEVDTTTYGRPTVGTPAASQVANAVSLTADGMTFGTRANSTTLSQSVPLVATGITAATIASSTTLSQSVALVASGITSGTEVGSTTLSQPASLTADSIEFGTEANPATLSQLVGLVADGIAFGTETTSTTLSQSATLTADSLTFATETTDAVLSQRPSLTADSIEFGAAVGGSSLIQSVSLAAAGIEFSTEASSTTITQTGELTAANIRFGTRVSSTTLTQRFGLTADGITFATAVGDAALSQTTTLVADALEFGTEAGDATLSQAVALVADSIEFATENGSSQVAANVALSPEGISFTTSVSDAVLSQLSSLVAEGVTFSTEVSPSAVSQSFPSLAADGITFATATGSAQVSQSVALSPDSLAFATTVGTVELWQTISLLADSFAFATTTSLSTITQSVDLVADTIAMATTVSSATLAQTIVVRTACIIDTPVDRILTDETFCETTAVSDKQTIDVGRHCQ